MQIPDNAHTKPVTEIFVKTEQFTEKLVKVHSSTMNIVSTMPVVNWPIRLQIAR